MKEARAGISSRGDIMFTQPENFIRGFGTGNLMLHELAQPFDDRRHGLKHPAGYAAIKAAWAAPHTPGP